MEVFVRNYLLLGIYFLYSTTNFCSCVRTGELSGIASYNDEHIRIPRIMKQYFREWTSSPKNNSILLQSIPVNVTELESETLLMTSPYRVTKNRILRTHLLIEFSNVKKQELRFKKYSAEFSPVIESQNLASTEHDCPKITITSKLKFHDDLLEMKFNIKQMYANYRKRNETHIKFKFRLYGMDGKTSDIDLRARQNNVFIILKEKFHKESVNILPTVVEEAIRQLNNNSKMFRKIPEFPHSQIAAEEKILTQVESTMEKRRKVPELRHSHYTEEQISPQQNDGRWQRKRNFPQLRHYSRPWRKGSRRNCGLKKWKVSFEKIGWDWVIAPQNYDLKICNGMCYFPLPDHFNASSHAVLRTIVNSVYGTPTAACCVPKDLGPLTMLFVETTSVTLRTFNDMVVKSCACL